MVTYLLRCCHFSECKHMRQLCNFNISTQAYSVWLSDRVTKTLTSITNNVYQFTLLQVSVCLSQIHIAAVAKGALIA